MNNNKKIFFDTSKNINRKIYQTSFILIFVILATIWGLFGYLYSVQIREDLSHLSYVAKSVAKITEIISSGQPIIKPAEQKILTEELTKYLTHGGQVFPGMGKTGEILIGTKSGDKFQYILEIKSSEKEDQMIRESSKADPAMMAAITGRSGTMVTTDVQGSKVLAAYESLHSLNIGVVVKTELMELQRYFFFTGFLATVFCIFFGIIGTRYIIDITLNYISLFEIREQKYHAYISYAPIGIFVIDEKGKFLEVNTKAGEFLGMNSDESLNSSLADYRKTAGMNLNEEKSIISKITELFNPDVPFENKKGENYYFMTNFVRFSQNRYLCFLTDLTESREVQIKLQESEAKFRGLYNSTKDAIIMTNENGMVVLWNVGAEGIFGYKIEEALNNNIADLIIPEKFRYEHLNKYKEYADTGKGQLIGTTFEFTGIKKTGDEIPVEITLGSLNLKKKRHAIAIIRDISQRKLMQSQLLQSSKMATLGEMATGVAHELNQPLSVIRMGSQMIERELKKGKINLEFLNDQVVKFLRNIDRAIKIINHLRIFGRKESGEGAIININLPIESAIDLLKSQLDHNSIKLSLDLQSDLPGIKGDQNSLEQVFINLFLNSVDVFEENSEIKNRQITISSGLLSEQDMIKIEFKNNGPLIPPDTLEKLFEPFFTTKPAGKGTGLGLSISYGIINAHKGSILALNTDNGPLFRILLPVNKQHADLQEI